jgi:hypothetical protein
MSYRGGGGGRDRRRDDRPYRGGGDRRGPQHHHDRRGGGHYQASYVGNKRGREEAPAEDPQRALIRLLLRLGEPQVRARAAAGSARGPTMGLWAAGLGRAGAREVSPRPAVGQRLEDAVRPRALARRRPGRQQRRPRGHHLGRRQVREAGGGAAVDAGAGGWGRAWVKWGHVVPPLATARPRPAAPADSKRPRSEEAGRSRRRRPAALHAPRPQQLEDLFIEAVCGASTKTTQLALVAGAGARPRSLGQRAPPGPTRRPWLPGAAPASCQPASTCELPASAPGGRDPRHARATSPAHPRSRPFVPRPRPADGARVGRRPRGAGAERVRRRAGGGRPRQGPRAASGAVAGVPGGAARRERRVRGAAAVRPAGGGQRRSGRGR